MNRIFLLLLTATTLILGCSKEDQAEIDRDLILNYIQNNNLNAEEDPSGVFYVIDVPGSEEKPTINSTVTVSYRGTLLDGFQFDASMPGMPISFPLAGVIRGWQIGIPKFGRGGSGKLLIPSGLAYGARGAGSVPGNAVLIFDIDLVDF